LLHNDVHSPWEKVVLLCHGESFGWTVLRIILFLVAEKAVTAAVSLPGAEKAADVGRVRRVARGKVARSAREPGHGPGPSPGVVGGGVAKNAREIATRRPSGVRRGGNRRLGRRTERMTTTTASSSTRRGCFRRRRRMYGGWWRQVIYRLGTRIWR
jgi:hypothetical protein